VKPDIPHPLDYAKPEPRRLPPWLHGLLAIFWVLVALQIYGGAIMAPIILVISIYAAVHPSEHFTAFGEPVLTTWQKTRCIGFAVLLTAVFISLAIWFRRIADRKS